MGYYARKWLWNLWCIACLAIFIAIAGAFQLSPFGIFLGAIIAIPLLFINLIIRLIKRGATRSKITQLICPKCMIPVDKETGICPQCGTKL